MIRLYVTFEFKNNPVNAYSFVVEFLRSVGTVRRRPERCTYLFAALARGAPQATGLPRMTGGCRRLPGGPPEAIIGPRAPA